MLINYFINLIQYIFLIIFFIFINNYFFKFIFFKLLLLLIDELIEYNIIDIINRIHWRLSRECSHTNQNPNPNKNEIVDEMKKSKKKI